ncbi:MAG: glycosyltransferase family 9 protein [Comamonadaceae bacterium]|nr:glycosyltransferase family 9 protein [Comamonadaceae bacterium]
MAGIPLRLAHCRENPYGLLSDWVPEPDTIGDDTRHEVRRQLDLVAAVGWRTGDEQLRFALRDADDAAVRSRLTAAGFRAGARYALIHPGASAPSRRWPPERFAAVGQALAEAGLAVVVAGQGEDLPLRDAVLAAMRAPVLAAGDTSLGELAALIAGAELLVANNSGPAHLAAALGTPVVVLYALTNPQHEPWRVPSRVLARQVPCRWCLKSRCPQRHHECLLGVGADEATRAALALAGTAREQTMEQDA